MTRDDAIAIAKRLGSDRPWYESEVDLLAELGLIKFDPVYDTRDLIFSSQKPCAYQAIAQLEALGYEIKLRKE